MIAAPEQHYAVAANPKPAHVPAEVQSPTFVPENTVTVADQKSATRVMRLIAALGDDSDVQNVHSDFDSTEEVLESIAG